MTQITRLEISNVKKIRAVSIEPDGSLVIVAGDNGAGKSSVLDAVMYALAGGRAIPEEPLRKGATRGAVKLELDNGLVVERTFTKKGSQLRVTQKLIGDKPNEDGHQLVSNLKSPQRVLDELYGQMSFDPLQFTRMRADKRLEMLQGMVGEDVRVLLAQFERAGRDAHEKRTEVNREIKRLSALNLHIGDQVEDTAIIDTEDLAEQLHEMDGQVEAIRLAWGEARDALGTVDRSKEVMANIAKALTDAKRVVEATEADAVELKAVNETLVEREKQMRRRAEQLDSAKPDRQGVLAKLAQAGEQNANAAAAKIRNGQRKALYACEESRQQLTVAIEIATERREEALAQAALPIAGLTFDDTGVRVDGQPWDQASSAEQLRVSAAMGIALNPELKVLLIRDGSLLDETSLRMLSELAEGAGAQVWLEMVGDRADAAVVLEDGHVRGESLVEATKEYVGDFGMDPGTDDRTAVVSGFDGAGATGGRKLEPGEVIEFAGDHATEDQVVDPIRKALGVERTAHVDEQGVDTPAAEKAFGPQDGESESDRSRGPEGDEWETFGKRGSS